MIYNHNSFGYSIIPLVKMGQELSEITPEVVEKLEQYREDRGLRASVIAISARSPEAAQAFTELDKHIFKDEIGEPIPAGNSKLLSLKHMKLAEELHDGQPTVYFRADRNVLVMLAQEGFLDPQRLGKIEKLLPGSKLPKVKPALSYDKSDTWNDQIVAFKKGRPLETEEDDTKLWELHVRTVTPRGGKVEK